MIGREEIFIVLSSSYSGFYWSSEAEALNTVSTGGSATPKFSRYDRKEWRYGIDIDGDCQNTRAELLISLSSKPVVFKDKRNCIVFLGEWKDFYFSETLKIASDVHIDHLVSLNEAHNSGGAGWPQNKKEAFANDPENLVITSAQANLKKGSNDIHSWVPSIPEYACRYLLQWIYIKQKYGLNISEAERGAVDNKKCLPKLNGEST